MKRKYKKVKEYKYYVLFENIKTGAKECFLKTDLKNGILKSNRKNNASGVAEVSLVRDYFQAYIYVNGKQKYLGNFKNLEDAKKAREDAEIMYKGKLELKG